MTDSASARKLRTGWTTGACATAATRAAYTASLTGEFPDPVTIELPGGARPAFVLAMTEHGRDFTRAGIVKDAGDDPDVTHGALVVATVRAGTPGSGVTFKAGEGIGTVTRPGLALPPNEPAINPVPRQMMSQAVADVARAYGGSGDVIIEISIPGGTRLAERTLNGRLGIVGGLSILGTTGIVVPYSCSAWIHSIHRGIDVARAAGLTHIAGATGSTSEAAVKALHGLDDLALIEMGDFVGGMLKYLRLHPIENITIAGGFAKMTKLGQGLLDLHSRRGEVDFRWLAERVEIAGGSTALVAATMNANTAAEVVERTAQDGLDLAGLVARAAWRTVASVTRGADVSLGVVVFDRTGRLLGQAPFRSAREAGPSPAAR